MRQTWTGSLLLFVMLIPAKVIAQDDAITGPLKCLADYLADKQKEDLTHLSEYSSCGIEYYLCVDRLKRAGCEGSSCEEACCEKQAACMDKETARREQAVTNLEESFNACLAKYRETNDTSEGTSASSNEPSSPRSNSSGAESQIPPSNSSQLPPSNSSEEESQLISSGQTEDTRAGDAGIEPEDTSEFLVNTETP